jgi:uncharacterized protein YjbI with pentapeptide repeats
MGSNEWDRSEISHMDGAQMSGAQLLKSDLQKASVQYAFLEGTLLNEANLTQGKFRGIRNEENKS